MKNPTLDNWLEELRDKKQDPSSGVWYLEVPAEKLWGERGGEYITQTHHLPMAFSEWWSFWKIRFSNMNGGKLPINFQPTDIVKFPLITDQECFDYGL